MPQEKTGEKIYDYTIGRLAALTDSKVQTIRYYEEIGLLPEPKRTAGNQRRYGKDDLDRLNFIRHARRLGFPLDRIRDMLDLAGNPDRSCADIDKIARDQLSQVEARIAVLEDLRGELRRMVTACAGGTAGDCRIVEVLSDHSLCKTDHPAAVQL